jgi:hypothetical protein
MTVGNRFWMAASRIGVAVAPVKENCSRRGASNEAEYGNQWTRRERTDQKPDKSDADPRGMILYNGCKRTAGRLFLPGEEALRVRWIRLIL